MNYPARTDLHRPGIFPRLPLHLKLLARIMRMRMVLAKSTKNGKLENRQVIGRKLDANFITVSYLRPDLVVRQKRSRWTHASRSLSRSIRKKYLGVS